MPSAYNVTLKSGASNTELEAAKKKITDKGGKITNEFSIVPGFTAEFPDDMVSTLESDHSVTVEKDAEVKTQ